MVALARMVNQTELETSSRQAVECESCKKNSPVSDVKFTNSEVDQPATPIIAEISQQNSEQSSPKEPKEQAVATTEINQQNSEQSSPKKPKEQAVATTEISQQNSEQSSPKEPATSSSSEQAVQQTKEIEPQEQMLNELAQLVVDLPIGTNLGMFHFLWMMVTGQ